MAGTTEAVGDCREGWSALRAGDWQRARLSFESAAASGGTPEAYEGLSWAAWWLDDAQVVFSAREAAYRLYRARRRPEAAARMATWRAADEFDFRGGQAVARGWLRRAHRLLDPLEPGPDHGWLAFHEGYIAHTRGDTAMATSQARRAGELGRRFDVADLEMLGLALEGAALVASARVEEGMRCLDEATATALEGEAEIPISSAWACCFLVGSCTAVLDIERAAAWCDRIAEFAERHASRYMLAFCRTEYGAVSLWRGSWERAEALLEAAVDDFSSSRPAWVGAPLSALAELRRRQGRAADTERLLTRTTGTRATLCGARLALDRGDARRAIELAERALRAIPEDRRLERMPALEVLAHAHVTRGHLDGASDVVDELRKLLALVETVPLAAAVHVADGVLARARGEHERARRLLEDAVDSYAGCGMPFEEARTRIELATTLAASGRTTDAVPELMAARDTLAALGAEGEIARVDRLLGAHAGSAPKPSPGAGVTRREREVLALLAEGLTNRQIAERLVVSEHTVHRHVTSILRKLDLPSRTAAAVYAVRLELDGRSST